MSRWILAPLLALILALGSVAPAPPPLAGGDAAWLAGQLLDGAPADLPELVELTSSRSLAFRPSNTLPESAFAWARAARADASALELSQRPPERSRTAKHQLRRHRPRMGDDDPARTS